MSNVEVYGPCPCGSGAKYKFCCLSKGRARGHEGSAGFSSPSAVASNEQDFLSDGRRVLVGDLEEGNSLNRKGLELMSRSQFAKAIPIFRKAIQAASFVHTARNNLALCLYITGKLDEAIREQRMANEVSPLPNPFGLANLASFLYVSGDEEGYERHLAEALAMEMPSADACTKICEALSRTQRHQDILTLVERGPFAVDENLSLMAGIAAANLGKRSLAQKYLRAVGPSHPKADIAMVYRDCLQKKTTPATVRGDWPYLRSTEVCPFDLITAEMKRSKDDWFSRRIAVDCAEAMLNESKSWEDAMILLSPATHPRATELLQAIAQGNFGPDALRIRAAACLRDKGALEPDQTLDMQVRGSREKVVTNTIRLNSEFSFADPLPDALMKLYEEAVEESHRKKPKWKKVEANCRRILEEVPSHLSSRYNLALSFLQQGRNQEAEKGLRELVSTNPEYLFPRASLLQVLSVSGRIKEARELLRSTSMPEETHPDAMVSWLIAQAVFHRDLGDAEAALECLKTAYEIDPDNPLVTRLMGMLRS